MTDPVKTRNYNAPLRKQQAAATRSRILAAAASVFTAMGYTVTRIEDVSAAAGVATATVYKAFGTKSALLTAAVEVQMAGSESMTAIERQPWWQEQLTAEAATQLGLIARNARAIYERAGGLLEVVRAAAAEDSAIAELSNRVNDQRLERSRVTAASLAEKGALRDGVTVANASLTLWALSAPELHTLLVGQAGMKSSDYEDWVASGLRSLLLEREP